MVKLTTRYTGFKTRIEANKKAEEILIKYPNYKLNGFGYNQKHKHFFEIEALK